MVTNIFAYFWFLASAWGIELECDFIFYHGYTCQVDSTLKFSEKNDEIVNVSGTHVPGKSSFDVETLYFKNSSMNFIPVGYSKFLPNVKHIYVFSAPIKSISSSNFENPLNLKTISLTSTEIKYLKADVFDSVINLEELALKNNKFTNIDLTILRFLNNLKKLDLSGNKLEFLTRNLFNKNENLREIYLYNNKLRAFDEGFFSVLNRLEKIDLRSNICIDEVFHCNACDLKKVDDTIQNSCNWGEAFVQIRRESELEEIRRAKENANPQIMKVNSTFQEKSNVLEYTRRINYLILIFIVVALVILIVIPLLKRSSKKDNFEVNASQLGLHELDSSRLT